METIHNYLDNMFITLPVTPETIKAKEELRCMMEDKYNEMIAEGKTEGEAIGTVISEFGDLKEVAKELGIRELLTNTGNNCVDTGSQFVSAHKLTIDETKDALKSYIDAAYAVALGVFLCICAPIGPIIGDMFGSTSVSKIVMNIVGNLFLFAFVGIAVALFISYPAKRKKYKYMKKDVFILPAEMIAELQDMHKKAESTKITKLVIGIILCIFSVVPSIVFEGVIVLEIVGSNRIGDFGGMLLLLFVAIGVFLIVSANMVADSYKTLLRYNKEC